MISNSPHILLIDDNRHGLAARRNILEQDGYSVEIACCGRDGVAQFQNGTFDLVVTDFRMPDLNGPEVIRQIRQRAPGTPIVLLSGFAGILGLGPQDTGADIVLAKGPNEHFELTRAIGSLIRRKPAMERGSGQLQVASA